VSKVGNFADRPGAAGGSGGEIFLVTDACEASRDGGDSPPAEVLAPNEILAPPAPYWLPFLGPGRLGFPPVAFNTASFARFEDETALRSDLTVDKGSWLLNIPGNPGYPVPDIVPIGYPFGINSEILYPPHFPFKSGALFGNPVPGGGGKGGGGVGSFRITAAVQLNSSYSTGTGCGIGIAHRPKRSPAGGVHAVNAKVRTLMAISAVDDPAAPSVRLEVWEVKFPFSTTSGRTLLSSVVCPDLGMVRHIWLRLDYVADFVIDPRELTVGDHWSVSADGGATWMEIPLSGDNFFPFDTSDMMVLGIWGGFSASDAEDLAVPLGQPATARILSLDWPVYVAPPPGGDLSRAVLYLCAWFNQNRYNLVLPGTMPVQYRDA